MSFPTVYEDETWTYSDKPQKALKMLDEIIELLYKEKNCQHVRSELDDVRTSLKREIDAREWWKLESSIPYYGG